MIMIEESCLMAGKLEKEKEKRLSKQDIKITVWKEQKMMIDLIGGIDNLRLETFPVELLEHDTFDGWMLELLGERLLDEDVENAVNNGTEDMV